MPQDCETAYYLTSACLEYSECLPAQGTYGYQHYGVLPAPATIQAVITSSLILQTTFVAFLRHVLDDEMTK